MNAAPLPHRRALLAAGLAAPFAGLHAQPAAAAVQDGEWLDARDAREAGGAHDAPTGPRRIPWRVRWPDGSGPCALVLFSHGLGGSREGADAWGEAWRAAGLAVLHLQHPGSDAEVLRGGMSALRAAASAAQLIARVRDMRFAMDDLARRAAAGDAPWARVRAEAIGVAGHSFGAHTVQALAGQRYRVAADFADARPRGFIAFSPSPGRGAGALSSAEAFGAIARPFLAVTGSLDGDPLGGHADGAPRVTVYQSLPPGQRALLWLEGADHMTFAGNAERRIRGGAFWRRERVAEQNEAAHHALVAHSTALWWRAHLLGDAQARRALASTLPGMAARDRFETG